jgi:phosphatidylserine/phosphatidylglycerophosphate/cardiolipin synthase-like enzyme
MTRRVIRKSRLAGLRDARTLLEIVLAAECVEPSEVLWVISPWISDVPVFDNRGGSFRVVLADAGERDVRLSEVLVRLAENGSTVVVATRDDDKNAPFLAALANHTSDRGTIDVLTSNDLHEKTLAGDDFVLSGSMNFTQAGLDWNEEQVTLDTDPETVAAARRDLRSRWGPDSDDTQREARF